MTNQTEPHTLALRLPNNVTCYLPATRSAVTESLLELGVIDAMARQGFAQDILGQLRGGQDFFYELLPVGPVVFARPKALEAKDEANRFIAALPLPMEVDPRTPPAPKRHRVKQALANLLTASAWMLGKKG